MQRNKTAEALARSNQVAPFGHTTALLDDLRDSGDWNSLREHAERMTGLPDPAARLYVKRLLALSLRHSSEQADHELAKAHYTQIAESPSVEATDLANLAAVLMTDGDFDNATATVLRGIDEFPDNAAGFVDIGMQIVEATGDRTLRERLRAAAPRS